MQASTSRTARLRGLAPVWLIALAVCLLGVAPIGPASTAHAATATPVNAAGVNIDAGGSGDTTFQADEYYSGGLTADNNSEIGNPNWPVAVAHPIPATDWNTYRYLDNTYQVPSLTPGAAYQVRLYFLDWYYTQVGQRVFNVAINGTPVLSNFDIVQAAGDLGGDGTHLGVEKDFTATADASGNVAIAFTRGSANQAMVNAISVVPVNGPVNIDAGGAGDSTFLPDQDFSGGTAGNNNGQQGNTNWPGGVANAIPVGDWNTFRTGVTTYQIPGLVAGSAYQVRLYFLDWLHTQVGQRVFNVAINGAPVLSNFDIVQAAGNLGADGTYQGIEKDFAATADANGDVTIAFTAGSADQPLVNAISVVPSS